MHIHELPHTESMSNLVNTLDDSKFFGWTNWNDFQRLLRGKGLSMHELQDIYVRYIKCA